MNNGIRIVIAIIAVVLPGVEFGQVKSDQPIKTVRISGQGISDYTGAPIRNVALRLRLNGREESISTQTGQDGSFIFPEVPANQHYNLFIGGSAQALMGLDVGQAEINMGYIGTQLNRPVRITGRIVGYAGTLIGSETLRLNASGREESTTTQTDDNGSFTFPGVRPARRYALSILVSGFTPTVMDVQVDERDVNMGTIVIQPLRPGPLASVRSTSNIFNGPSIKIAHISGRIVNPIGVPFSGQTVNFTHVNEISTAKTNQDGTFAFPAVSGTPYEFYLPELPNAALTIEAVGGQKVELANIVIRTTGDPKPTIEVLGPVQVTESESAAKAASVQTPKAASVAVIYITASGSVHIVHGDGKVVQPQKEKEQVSCSSPLISEDKQAVGWLVDSDFCCTSYPIDLILAVYRPGKPLRQFTGDGRAIFDWRFVAGGKQVAFYQDFLHGNPGQHYELRDIETGRLIGKWDGALTPKAPRWTRGMR